MPEWMAKLVSDGAVTVEEACKFLGVKRSTVYSLMSDNVLPWSKVAGRRVIPVAALRQLLADGMHAASVGASNG